VVAPHLQPDAEAWVAGATVKVDAERAARQQAFDDANVVDGGDGRIVLLISLGEGVAITLEEDARPRRVVDARELVAELVDPGAHDRLDRALEAGAIRMRRLARREGDDEVDADQRPLGKERMEGAHAALVGVGEIITDGLAHAAAEALARDVNKDRHEAIEAVAPRQDSHARPLVELQYRQREVIERVLVELKQL